MHYQYLHDDIRKITTLFTHAISYSTPTGNQELLLISKITAFRRNSSKYVLYYYLVVCKSYTQYPQKCVQTNFFGQQSYMYCIYLWNPCNLRNPNLLITRKFIHNLGGDCKNIVPMTL